MIGPAVRRTVVALTAAAALATSGCNAGGAARTLGSDSLVDALTDDVVAHYGAEAQDVQCPTGLAVKEGSTFECTVAVDGGTVTYRITQVDGDGQLAFEPLQAVLDPARPAARIAIHYVEVIGKSVDVFCGQRELAVRVVEVGGTFVCRVADRQGREDGVVVTVNDLEGSFSFEVVPGDTTGADF